MQDYAILAMRIEAEAIILYFQLRQQYFEQSRLHSTQMCTS